jgi:2-polyprenyl-3-methyl-5-hydroxy-6-metoxy-1,4-benzoquinol methylase
MINSAKFFEAYLQKNRFTRAIPFLKGDVLDFGGNNGELKKYVSGSYTLVNYDHSPMENKTFDTIVALAVLEHLPLAEVYPIFHLLRSKLRPGGLLLLTTPTPMARPVLELLAYVHILDKQNIEEHTHYWNKKEILNLAHLNGFTVKDYKKFQFGFNQVAMLVA